MRANTIVIIGATSAVAQACARVLIGRETHFVLIGRNADKLALVQQDLISRGAKEARVLVHETSAYTEVPRLLGEVLRVLGHIDLVFIAQGSLGDEERAQGDFPFAERECAVNWLSIVAWLDPLAAYFAERRAGSIAVISSVAGERGRKSNYHYGAAKGALSIFLQGMRNRLHPFGVQVLTVQLGPVRSPMTAHMKKGLLMASSASAVAPAIVAALGRRADVVYVPWYWRPLMGVIRALPERVAKRLNW